MVIQSIPFGAVLVVVSEFLESSLAETAILGGGRLHG